MESKGSIRSGAFVPTGSRLAAYFASKSCAIVVLAMHISIPAKTARSPSILNTFITIIFGGTKVVKIERNTKKKAFSFILSSFYFEFCPHIRTFAV